MIGSSRQQLLFRLTALVPVAHRKNGKCMSRAQSTLVHALCCWPAGGAPAQADMIHQHIRRRAKETKTPVFSFAQDVGASGGYSPSTLFVNRAPPPKGGCGLAQYASRPVLGCEARRLPTCRYWLMLAGDKVFSLGAPSREQDGVELPVSGYSPVVTTRVCRYVHYWQHRRHCSRLWCARGDQAAGN